MFVRLIQRLWKLPLEFLNLVVEGLLSRRGLVLGFFLIAAIFATGTWLRPPLSADLRGGHLPLGIFASDPLDAEALLFTPRPFRLDSIAVVLLVAIVIGAIFVAFWPRSLGTFAGVLMAISMACCAAAVLNHPQLIELLDGEILQRQQLQTVLRGTSEQSLAGNSPPRMLPLILPKTDNSPVLEELEPGDTLRGWSYIVYGPWLLFLAMFIVLLETRGPWQKRFGHVGVWSVLGFVLAAGVCARRLQAEYHWSRAEEFERRGELQSARVQIGHAMAIFPEFDQLERTWKLLGKLDYRQNRQTPHEMYFRVSQLALNNQRSEALALLDELLAVDSEPPPAVRHLAGLIYSDMGRKYFVKQLITAAEDSYRRACRIAPYRIDAVIGLGTTLAQIDRNRPQVVEAHLGPLADRVGDRTLRADLYERLGDVYFEAGLLSDARQRYQRSLEIFCQPKYVNAPAQEGMLGM